MDDGVHKSSSSLSHIINKQQQAYVSCEETQTLFDYYVSSLQANLKAPGDVQADGSVYPKDELNKLGSNFREGHNNDAVPLADFSRKPRQRYQSPLETIEEYDHRLQDYKDESIRQTPAKQFEDPKQNANSLPGNTRQYYDGTASRLTNGRGLKSGVRMLYHTEMWAPDDQYDHLHDDNASLMREKPTMLNSNCKSNDLHTEVRATNSLSESIRNFIDHVELKSKSDASQAEVCSKDKMVSSAQRATGEEDGAITVLPKLSVVDIQRCHADRTSNTVVDKQRCHADRTSDMQGLYQSALQELKSLQVGTQFETLHSDSTNIPVEKVEDVSSESGVIKKHSSRKDAEKHLDMVREKQQRAKELFTKLKSINNATIHTIALNSSMLLDASIEKVFLLSKSYSFEPEEVISSTTHMLEDLTNLISTTSNHIRQIAKSALAEGENLGIVPFLSGPRSISGIVSSTETLMSPVTFSCSSVEEDSRGSGIIATVANKKTDDSVTVTSVKNMIAPTISGQEPKLTNLSSGEEKQFYSSSDTDSEYEEFKTSDLISFVENHKIMPQSCPQFVRTREPITNLMDASIEELPGWKNTDNLMGAGEIINQWEGGESQRSGTSLSNQQYASNNGTIDNFQTVADGVPMSNNPRAKDEHQSPNTSKACSGRYVTSSETFAEHNSARQDVTQSKKISLSGDVKELPHDHKPKPRPPTHRIQTRNCKPSPVKTAHCSATQAANKSQQLAATMAYETYTNINVSRLAKDSTDTNNLYGPNKQLRNKSGPPIHQPGGLAKKDQKQKSNTLTVKSKGTKPEYTSKTDKTMKSLPVTKRAQLANKTLHRNVLNMSEKINVLKSCVENRNTCFEGRVNVERMAAERDICENLPLSPLLSYNRGFSNFTKVNQNGATERSVIPSDLSSTQNSKHPTINQGTSHTSACGNKGKNNNMDRLKTPVSSPVVTREIIQDKTAIQQGCAKGCNSNHQSKKKQSKNESHNSKCISESNKHNQQPKRLMTHQEIQSWVNYSHQSHCRECTQHSKKYHKRCGSPNIKNVFQSPSSVGTKSTRSNLRRSKSSSPSSCRRSQSVCSKGRNHGVHKPHVSDTSIISELGSTYSAGVERSASQLIIDTLADAAQVAIKRSLSAKPGISLVRKSSELSLKSAKEIVSKLSSCSDKESEHHSSIEFTINHLVSSLDNTIDKTCDKRVCWDSSKDILPRGKSSSEETESKIFETGSRVLGTIAAQLMRKLTIEAESTSSRDDPETEVSFNSKRNWDLSSSSLEGLISDYSRHSLNGHNEHSQSRMPPISHVSNVNKLMDVIKSTSDGYFSEMFNTNKRNKPPQMTEANHAMAALEDLQALLSSLKCSMGEQTRPPSRTSYPLPPLRPRPQVKWNKTCPNREVAASSSEPEPTVEKCGDTIITTTVRAPVKRPSHSQSSPLPANRLNSFATQNRTSNTSAIHSSSSRLSNTTSTSCNSSLNSKSSYSDRSQSRILPPRAGYRMPATYANKSYGNLPSRPSSPQQYSTPRNNQTQDCWGNREMDLTLNSRRNKSEMQCSNSGSDNESVVSSSSRYTNRLHQLAQPKKRYMEATKDEYKHVLKRQYLERMQKKIIVAEGKKAQAPSKERRAKGLIRKQAIDIEKPIGHQEAGVAKPGSAEKNKETAHDMDELSSVNDENFTDENVSIHYNSPSDDSIVVGVNERQYYHYSDKSDYSSAAINTVQYGEIIYVGVDKKPNPETPHEFVDTPTQEVKQKAKFVTIDIDTWNIISQNCIANFQQDEQTFFIQTAIPPERHNEVSILEVTESQEDTSSSRTKQQESNVLPLEVQRGLKEMQNVPNTDMKLCTPNLECGPIDCSSSTFVTNKITESPSDLTIVNMEDAVEESVDGIIFSVMADIVNKAANLCNGGNRNSSIFSHDSENLSDSDYALTELVTSDQDALATKWDELNDSNRGKKYHPKRSIQNEVSIELEDYDSKTMFNIVKAYLSSESDSENNCSREILAGDTPELKQITPPDACALYELFSDSSDSIDDLTQYNTAMTKRALSEMSLFSSYTSALDTQETSAVCNVKLFNDVDLASGQIIKLNTMVLKDGAITDVEGRSPDNVATNGYMVLHNGKSGTSHCDTEYKISDQSSPETKASAENHNMSQPTAQSKWVDGDHTARQATYKENCVIGDGAISQAEPGLKFDDQHYTKAPSECTGRDLDNVLDSQTESVADGSIDGNTNAKRAGIDATHPHDAASLAPDIGRSSPSQGRKRYLYMFNRDYPTTSEVKPSNKTSGVGIGEDDSVTEQNNPLENENSEGVSFQLLDDIKPKNKSSSEGSDSARSNHQTNRLTLDTILPPDACRISAAFDESVSSIFCSGACLSESVVEPSSETGSCDVLPVIDLTSVDTVSNLLCALTHVKADSDMSLSSPSMDSLLKQFSNVALPGDQERHVTTTREESLDSLLDSLAFLPQPIFDGMYSSCSIRLGGNPSSFEAPSPSDSHRLIVSESVTELMSRSSPRSMHNIDTPITCGSLVTRSVQTDHVDLNMRPLSVSEIHLGFSANQTASASYESSPTSNTVRYLGSKSKSETDLDQGVEDLDEEIHSSVSSPGLLFDTDAIDLPHVSDAEQQSVEDLAIYTDVLMSYSTREKLDELLATLDALKSEEEEGEREESSDTVEGGGRVSNRRAVIMSFVSCVTSMIMFGVFTLPNVCDLRNS